MAFASETLDPWRLEHFEPPSAFASMLQVTNDNEYSPSHYLDVVVKENDQRIIIGIEMKPCEVSNGDDYDL
ncbi:hypothetical protein CDAR_574021 [Caerostris darwini]|uniref:Uncharacterized protein n=1 Tax=Caerostris darwini TaxID=1538125 RepID=A0AAV4T7Q4_9ARAC|nr:hypothetical protein CDAR_574021 [Caerostris darwini]